MFFCNLYRRTKNPKRFVKIRRFCKCPFETYMADSIDELSIQRWVIKLESYDCYWSMFDPIISENCVTGGDQSMILVFLILNNVIFGNFHVHLKNMQKTLTNIERYWINETSRINVMLLNSAAIPNFVGSFVVDFVEFPTKYQFCTDLIQKISILVI